MDSIIELQDFPVMRVRADMRGKGIDIPGGKYARRKLVGWEKVFREGMLPSVFQEFVRSFEPYVDHDEIRPSLEFYRSHDELILFMPISLTHPARKQ